MSGLVWCGDGSIPLGNTVCAIPHACAATSQGLIVAVVCAFVLGAVVTWLICGRRSRVRVPDEGFEVESES